MEFCDEKVIEHLAGMVRFPTVSNAVSAKMNFEPFFAMHDYLEKTYPLVHSTLKKEIIGKAGLLYTWSGTGESKNPPILLAAHQDVVPEGDHSMWKYPPYAGTIADGKLWGRGCGDCKSNIIAHMEAIEALIAEGYRPGCDVYLAYGYNEEVGGGDDNSAGAICGTLKNRDITLGCVVDEGRGVGPDKNEGINVPVAYIRTAEKGYADFEFSLSDPGGHSMHPGKRSILGILGAAMAKLSDNPMPYRLTSAVLEEYQAKRDYMGEKGEIFKKLETDFDSLIPVIDSNPNLSAQFHTTMALTMMSGSAQANIMPTRASFVMNCRLMEGDTVESLTERFRSIVGNEIEIRVLSYRAHSPISRTDSTAYRCLTELTKEMYPGSIVVPGVLGGGTDARNYYPICDSVYRYGGYSAGISGGGHNYNEFFNIEGCGKGPEFFYNLIKKYSIFE